MNRKYYNFDYLNDFIDEYMNAYDCLTWFQKPFSRYILKYIPKIYKIHNSYGLIKILKYE